MIPMMVRKRDGKVTQDFDLSKIITAIRGAWVEVHGVADDITIVRVARDAHQALIASTLPDGDTDVANTVDVETIQDAVEVALMRAQEFAVARAYIVYRQRRAEERAASTPDPKAIAQYIHASKYARYREDLGRREVYEETVARVEDMHLRKFAHVAGLDKDIRWAFDFVREKKVLPSMRAMQFGGAAMEANHARGYNCSATLIDRPRAFSEALYLLLSGCGVGYSVQYRHVDKLPPIAQMTDQVIHHVIEDTIEGWADAAEALINGAIAGVHVEFAYHLLRDKGALLKTSGGRAPGHLPLRRALERARAILLGAQGRQLRPMECHEILCHFADAVLAGGIRRSAMICLFSLDDGELLHCKADRGWYEKKPWLARANNSVVLKRDEVTEEQFRRIFKMTRMYGEPGFFFVSDWDHATNPCQPAWATVLTPRGIRTMGEIQIGDTIWSGKQWTKVTNKAMTGVKPVHAYHTRAGVFVGTENHRVVENGVKIEVRDAESVDLSVGPSPEELKWNPRHAVDGLVLGDGTYHHASRRVFLCAGKDEVEEYRREWGDLIGAYRPGVQEHTYEVDCSFDTLPLTYNREVPEEYFRGTDSKKAAFLRGLYTANGSVVANRVTLKAASKKVVLQVQEMLSSLGIPSYYTVNKPHDVKHHNGTYTSRQSYDLNIGTTLGRQRFERLIGFCQAQKQERLRRTFDAPSKGKMKTTYEIVDVEYLGDHEVYDITVEADEHTYWTGGLLVSNCAEIGLDPVLVREDDSDSRVTGWAFCNLTEINAALLRDAEDFRRAAHAATIIGTLQAAYTDMPYLGRVTEEIVRRDALIGVGMTGMQDAPDIALDPELQSQVASLIVEWNAQLAERIGINPAARCTTLKPSGTTTLMLSDTVPGGAMGSGIHLLWAEKCIRRVTANELEPPFQAFREKNPSMCEKMPDGNWSISFPVKAGENSRIRGQFTALEFLDMVRSTYRNWILAGTARESAVPGLRHNVSNTVTVKPDEWDDVCEYLFTYRHEFGAVSFLPDDGDVIYAHAPFEAVKTPEQERRWRELILAYRPVDYLAVREDGDYTSLSGENACAGGACAT